MLVGLTRAADRANLARVATAVLERDDRVTELLLAAADSAAEWRRVHEVLERRGGDPFNALDLIVELSQQAAVRRGKPRTWSWPPHSPRDRAFVPLYLERRAAGVRPRTIVCCASALCTPPARSAT